MSTTSRNLSPQSTVSLFTIVNNRHAEHHLLRSQSECQPFPQTKGAIQCTVTRDAWHWIWRARWRGSKWAGWFGESAGCSMFNIQQSSMENGSDEGEGEGISPALGKLLQIIHLSPCRAPSHIESCHHEKQIPLFPQSPHPQHNASGNSYDCVLVIHIWRNNYFISISVSVNFIDRQSILSADWWERHWMMCV